MPLSRQCRDIPKGIWHHVGWLQRAWLGIIALPLPVSEQSNEDHGRPLPAR